MLHYPCVFLLAVYRIVSLSWNSFENRFILNISAGISTYVVCIFKVVLLLAILLFFIFPKNREFILIKLCSNYVQQKSKILILIQTGEYFHLIFILFCHKFYFYLIFDTYNKKWRKKSILVLVKPIIKVNN